MSIDGIDLCFTPDDDYDDDVDVPPLNVKLSVMVAPTVSPSVPEPPPQPHGEAVTPVLLKWLDSCSDKDHCCYSDACDCMSVLVKRRDAFGRAKYGQPLMTKDGRDSVEDAMQELGDLAQYMFKARLNGENLDQVVKLLPLLQLIARA